MRKYKNILFVSIGLLFYSAGLQADDIRFNTSAPNVVNQGERFRLTYTMNSQPSGFKLPSMNNFNVVEGPHVSTNSQVQIINGQVSRNNTVTYTYFLTAKNTGRLTIPPASASFKGKTRKSNQVQIKVVKGTGGPASSAGSGTSDNQKEQGQTMKGNLFVRVLISDRDIYMGEPTVATVKIYVKPGNVNLSGISDYQMPDFKGFYQQEIETPEIRNLTRENVDGEVYGTGVLQKIILIPQRIGNITVEPAKVECVIRTLVRRQSQNLFDQFFGNQYKQSKTMIESQPVNINVKPLPSRGKPESFSNAVGQFDFQTSVDKNQVKENEAVNLTVSIIGNGNLELIEAPQINFPPDFEVYDPEVDLNIKNSVPGPSGKKSFSYLIIPRHEGEYRIPPVKFSYFNPNTNTYKTRSSKEYKINVLKGDETAGDNVITSVQKQKIQQLGKDIHYIKLPPFQLKQLSHPWYRSGWFYAGYGIPLAAFILFLIIRRKKIKENANIELTKNRKANSFARKRLKAASKNLQQQNEDLFYEEILKALWGYLSDKLTIPVSELTIKKAGSELKKHAIDDEIIHVLSSIIDHCEYARYAPAKNNTSMEEIYNKAANIILTLEKKLT